MSTSPTFPPTVPQPSSIPVSLIRQYCFCPRIPYFLEVLGLTPAETPWTRQGLDWHSRQAMLNKRRKLARYGLEQAKLIHDVTLRSESLGCHGRCDAILESADEVVPLEFKLSAAHPQRGHILQLCAYGLLAQAQTGKPFKRGFILHGNRGQTLEIRATPNHIRDVERAIAMIRKTLVSALLPDSPASAAQCGQCEYFNFCGDRETDHS